MEPLAKKTLLVVIIGGMALVLILNETSPSWARILASLPFIFFLPGYGITAILFPRRALDIPARLLLTAGLSLATMAFSGLILNLTPGGIRLQNPWMIVLIGGTGLTGLCFLIRDAFNVDGTTILAHIGFHPRQIFMLVLAAFIAIVAIDVARTPVSPKNFVGYTMLWVQPDASPDTLKLGVQSEEFQTTEYQLRFEINETLREGPTFELKSGQTREFLLKLDGEKLAGQPIVVLLYRLDHPNEVYRRVLWWYEND